MSSNYSIMCLNNYTWTSWFGCKLSEICRMTLPNKSLAVSLTSKFSYTHNLSASSIRSSAYRIIWSVKRPACWASSFMPPFITPRLFTSSIGRITVLRMRKRLYNCASSSVHPASRLDEKPLSMPKIAFSSGLSTLTWSWSIISWTRCVVYKSWLVKRSYCLCKSPIRVQIAPFTAPEGLLSLISSKRV